MLFGFMDVASEKNKEYGLDWSILYGIITLLAARKAQNPKKTKVLGLD